MKRLALLTCLALTAAAPAAASTHTGTIEAIQLTGGSEFISASATFKEVGGGSSKVAVWIEVYDGPSGGRKATLGRRTATTSCDPGRTCWTTLKSADVPVLPGECYVGWGSIDDGGGAESERTPTSGRYCP
jgi:hypothetical protein